MFSKSWKRPGKGDGKRSRGYRLSGIAVIILVLTLAASGSVKFCVNRIRANVRSATVQIISELTGSKSLVLASILEEMVRDMRNLAFALGEAGDSASAARMADNFREIHQLEALLALDQENEVFYGSEEALAMKGIPPDFEAQVESQGLAISDTVLGVDGSRVILFGAAIPGGGVVYGSLPTSVLQLTFGEDTYLGEGYSYVLERDGTIIIPPVRYGYEQIYDNIRALLEDGNNPAYKQEQFMKALSEGRSGSVIFTIRGKEQILCFASVDNEKEWQFVTVVPLEVAEKDGARTIQTAVYMAFMIIGAIVLALVSGLLFYLYAQRRQRDNDRFLRDIYQAISENTDTVIFILNSRTSRPDYVFENSGRLLGIPAADFYNCKHPSGEMRGFHRELQELLAEEWPEEGCRREVHTYNDCLHRDMWLKVLICPFRQGDELKCIYAITDITKEHKDRENIAAAVVAAQQANAAKSRFFSNMSHDMRTPMNGIVGMTAIARRNLDNRDKVVDCLNKIDYSSRHLLGLINDVLDMSKIESGKLILSSDPVDLQDLFMELEAILKSQCEDRQQTLTLQVRLKHRAILGDSLRLKQIFMNLLSNAVKFTPRGGDIMLLAEEEQGQRQTEFATYHFSVSDNGIGMPSDFQKIIFNPFERAGSSTVHQTEGTGLGMAITKSLVSAMGGQISLESQVGRGTTFYVDLELPLEEAEAVKVDSSVDLDINECSFEGKRFLLAEDNAINQEIAVELLSRCGARIEAADNGKQAVKMFLDSAPGYYDAILMDIQMPVMNGYEAARAIRSGTHSQGKTIPIIAMTAYVFAEDVLAAKNAGMDAHVPKPLELKRLYQALMEASSSGKHADPGEPL